MLKVTLHKERPDRATAFNMVGRMDIGYAKLAAIADYKVSMFSAGLGEIAPTRVEGYPRWSASVWDLIARAACLSLNHKEAIWPTDIPVRRRGSFIRDLCAIVEHWPDGRSSRRATVATAHIQMCTRRRNYRATFEDDLVGEATSDVFAHTPEVLTFWDLLTRAYAWTFNGTLELPKRPKLCVPLPLEHNGGSYVLMDTLQEPSRSGVRRWMVHQGISPATLDAFDGDCLTEKQFVTFLETAV